MRYPKTEYLVLFLLSCLFALCLVACKQQQPTQSSNASLQITLLASPAGAASGYQIVQLTNGDGQPITDATVSLEGNMNHGGMAPMIGEAVTDEADGQADGRYQAPLQFTMLGDWVVTVAVQTKDGATITQDIPVQVGEQGITINN